MQNAGREGAPTDEIGASAAERQHCANRFLRALIALATRRRTALHKGESLERAQRTCLELKSYHLPGFSAGSGLGCRSSTGGLMGSDTQSLGRLRGRDAALCAVVTSVAVVAGGWVTNARQVLHALLYGVGTALFLPFLVIAGAIAFALFLGILVGLTAGDAGVVEQSLAGDAAEGGIRLIRPYYRFLGRQRHPWLLGSIAGLILGCLGLWLLIALLIAPREAETAALMAQIQSDLEASYSPDRGFVADVEGKLLQSALDPAAARVAIEDSFGRSLILQLGTPRLHFLLPPSVPRL